MPPRRGRGKKQAETLREGDRGLSRPSGLIRPFEVVSDAPIKQTDGDTMTIVITRGQGTLVAERRVSVHQRKYKTRRGKRRRMNLHCGRHLDARPRIRRNRFAISMPADVQQTCKDSPSLVW
jgi:hypothetical protein